MLMHPLIHVLLKSGFFNKYFVKHLSTFKRRRLGKLPNTRAAHAKPKSTTANQKPAKSHASPSWVCAGWEFKVKDTYCSWTLVASSYSGYSYSVLTVDPNVHTVSFLTGFYCHFDHPQQYLTMLLPVKNGRLILTCKCTYYTWGLTVFNFLSALDIPRQVYQHFDWFWPFW